MLLYHVYEGIFKTFSCKGLKRSPNPLTQLTNRKWLIGYSYGNIISKHPSYQEQFVSLATDIECNATGSHHLGVLEFGQLTNIGVTVPMGCLRRIWRGVGLIMDGQGGLKEARGGGGRISGWGARAGNDSLCGAPCQRPLIAICEERHTGHPTNGANSIPLFAPLTRSPAQQLFGPRLGFHTSWLSSDLICADAASFCWPVAACTRCIREVKSVAGIPRSGNSGSSPRCHNVEHR